MKEWFDRNYFGLIVFSIVVFLVLVLIVSVMFGGNERNRLMYQCLDDGKKEYECRALLRNLNG